MKRIPLLLAIVWLAVFASPGVFAADLGDECEVPTLDPELTCPVGTSCLKAIEKRYCTELGKACGWKDEPGYDEGAKKTHEGKSYECTKNGFKRAKAQLGEECKMGMSVLRQYLCEGLNLCLQAIDKKYCSHPGRACGWSGTGGYNLGQERTYDNKRYECTMSGFQRAKAQLGEECKTGMNVPRHYLCGGINACRPAIDKEYCAQPGKVCGWNGSGGYALGQTKKQGSITYECTPAGFKSQASGLAIGGGIVSVPATGPKTRPLNAAETGLARRVFGRSLDLSQIRVTNTLGGQSRPWTSNSPPVYTLNIGPAPYDNLATNAWSGLLVHELTHVWQGQNGVAFMSNSAWHQAISAIQNGGSTSKAYQYAKWKQWRDYNVEQQASLVEDWVVADNQSRSSTRYSYIRDNVRPGEPHATTRLQESRRR